MLHKTKQFTTFFLYHVCLVCSPSLVVSFPAAPIPGPTLAYPSVPSYLPVESSFTPDVGPGAGVEDLPEPAATASLTFDSEPATETHDVDQLPEEQDDLLQQQLPRQIHIQQHLKLHFHQQGKFWRGSTDAIWTKYSQMMDES